MLKILAPTDFSNHSKAGLRFVLRWSTVQKIEIIFVHYFHTRRLTQWTDTEFNTRVENESQLFKSRLESFVHSIYKSTKIAPGKYSCLAGYGLSPDIAIMDYCRSHPGIDFICLSTRGAGKLGKILGTNSGNLTEKSDVPVITVPKNYRSKSINRILYATDLRNYKEELIKVAAFARPLNAAIQVLHLTDSNQIVKDEAGIETRIRKAVRFNISLIIKKRSRNSSILRDLQEQIFKLRPSLIIMFTNQHRNFFQKFISPSKTEQLSFVAKFPLLAFSKDSPTSR